MTPRFSTRIPTLFATVVLLLVCITAALAQNHPSHKSNNNKSTKKPTLSKTILFFGNSLTAGYGLDPRLAFPHLIQNKIDSLGLPFEVINAGLSGETSAGGLRRINWLLKRKIDILVLELGGNDALRGIDLDVTKRNLEGLIMKTRARYPGVKVVIAGMQVPPNFGKQYADKFREIYQQLAREDDATLIPFLLRDVGGVTELNQPDGIHPTAAGHKIIAKTVWESIVPLLVSEDN